MTKNVIRGILTFVILLAVFSVIAFVIPFPRNTVFWVAYGCGVFAILFQLYVFKTSFGKSDARSRFYGFPIAKVGICYLVAQLIVSIAEIALSKVLPVWAVIVINALILAAALIGCITTETMRDEIARQDQQLKKDVSRMRELQSLAASMLSQCNNDEEMKQTVKKIADELRFSDPVSSDATQELEDEMRSQMQDIQQAIAEGDTDGAKTLCGKVLGNLIERNRVCSNSK